MTSSDHPQPAAATQDGWPDFCRTHPTVSLFVVSVLILFLELMLIRWIGTEVRIFAYLQNTVLVVCFLGLGLGCFTCREPVSLRGLLARLLILMAVLAFPPARALLAGVSEMLSVLGDFVIWRQGFSANATDMLMKMGSGLVLVFLLMLLIWDMFVPIGRIMGRLLDDHPRTIWAYSVNVAGSLLGISVFVALSVFYLPPYMWIAVLAGLTVPFLTGRGARIDLGLLGVIVVLSWFASRQPGSLEVFWSPYQKLVLSGVDRADPDEKWVGEYLITVNNTGYQGLIDLSDAAPAKDPPEMRGFSQYDIPYLLHPAPSSALIVGAGAGNDAAGALRQGLDRVVAVEIDPAIIEIGRAYHQEKPYDSPRVTVVNDDARSFFSTCDEKFNVISFGLLDSHTMNAMTNARLDHYVYTRESIEQAATLLNPGGIISLSFEARKPYIADRIARSLKETFGAEPMSFRVPYTEYGWGGVMFIAGDLAAARQQLYYNMQLADLIKQFDEHKPVKLTYESSVITDDWPYLYLKSRQIPILFYLLIGLMVVLAFYSQRRLGVRLVRLGGARSQWHFFFLGAAFLLLEVQNISKAAVVLGSTWWVNAVVITAILAMVLLANAIAALWRNLPLAPVYALLLGSCITLYFVDISRFAFMPYALKATIVGGLTTLPMLFSGIVFIRSFAAVKEKGQALGANLIGALVGGLLQSVTFVTGIKALLLIVTVLYLAAMITRVRGVPAAEPARAGY